MKLYVLEIMIELVKLVEKGFTRKILNTLFERKFPIVDSRSKHY